MLFGDPEKFAFLIEKVPEWSDESFANGLLYVCINWEMFPKDLRNTTLSDDLQFLLDKEHPYGMFCLVNDEKLYALSDKELFAELRLLRFPMYFTENEDADEDDDYCLDLDVDDDYRFDLDLVELGDCHYHLFAVSNGENVRVLIGHWGDSDSFELVNSVEITLEEYTKIRDELWEYYVKEIRGGQNG